MILDPTSHSFMDQLKLIYKDKIITPYHNAKEVLAFLKTKFNMLKITYIENLDPMTRETIRMAPIRVSKNTEFYRIEKNENSAPFYKYFNDRFAYEPSLCIIYDKDSETICSNCCELLNVYITILHGIDSNEIEENTGVYKSYLNSLYLFDSCQGKL